MCYFSMEGPSREAREDEVLVVKKQPYGSNWLVSPDDTCTAVCLKDGTEIELLYIPEPTRREFHLDSEAEGVFKTNWWRRDLFVFMNTKIQLKKLLPGQVVRILSREKDVATDFNIDSELSHLRAW